MYKASVDGLSNRSKRGDEKPRKDNDIEYNKLVELADIVSGS